MKTKLYADQIASYMAERSNFDTHRKYLGMSKLADCPRKVFREFKDGVIPTEDIYRMSYAGYEHEKNILAMLQECGIAMPVQRELIAPFDNRLRGHIDAETVDGFLCEIKSVSDKKYQGISSNKRMPYRNFAQVQVYMRYGGYERSLVVYRNRDTYQTILFDIPYNPNVADKLERKAKRILEAIDSGQLPECDCHTCK